MKRKLLVEISLAAAMGCYAMVQIYQMTKRSFTEFSKPTILEVVDSPNHKWKAVLATFDCGVACDLENSVAVIPTGFELMDDNGVVFRSFAGAEQKIVTTEDRPTQYGHT